MCRGINSLIVDDWMTVRRLASGGQVEIILGDLAAIPARALRFHIDCAEKSSALLAAVALPTDGICAVHHVAAFMLGKQCVHDRRTARRCQTTGIGANKRSI